MGRTLMINNPLAESAAEHVTTYQQWACKHTRELSARDERLKFEQPRCSTCILIYDHMVTLPEEIRFIWCRPKILSSIFFLVNRYFALVGNVFGLFIDFLPAVSDKMAGSHLISAEVLTLLRELHLFLQQITVAFTLTLRIHALYGRNWRLLSCMVIIGLALMAGASASSYSDNNTTTYIQGSDCHNTFTAEAYVIPFIGHGLAWIAVFVYDLLIFVLMVFRTCKTRGLLRLSLSSRDIPGVIFQDGIFSVTHVIYILNQENAGVIAMTLINIPNILMYYCGSVSTHPHLASRLANFLTIDKDITRGNLATFTGCMSVTLVSRLVLNLHKSTDDGIFSAAIRNDGPSLDVITTSVQAVVSSHN
ncbi:hypothetical protein F4604DRAFT_1681591 [Suillus subluteus]|nr:hypothetical protein F4604DRAFT_1681591 [Suillus subluteus]